MRACGSGQWGGGFRKGFPHNGRCPEIQGGNRQTAPGFSPPSPWGNFSPRSGTKAAWSGLAGTETHSPTRGPSAPARAGPRFLPPATASFSPHLASAPPLLKSPRAPGRAAEAAAGTRVPRRVSWPANQHGARGAAAREPKPGRLLPLRAEPDRAEPSQAEPRAQSAGGGGAEPR